MAVAGREPGCVGVLLGPRCAFPRRRPRRQWRSRRPGSEAGVRLARHQGGRGGPSPRRARRRLQGAGRGVQNPGSTIYVGRSTGGVCAVGSSDRGQRQGTHRRGLHTQLCCLEAATLESAGKLPVARSDRDQAGGCRGQDAAAGEGHLLEWSSCPRGGGLVRGRLAVVASVNAEVAKDRVGSAAGGRNSFVVEREPAHHGAGTRVAAGVA